ncbi:hypothetical protein EIP91_011981 [Steccherinum ochraceum]|uniref:Heparinase II N-terminal domain-containing protein n=1 Tax=Steccherinum ochraceum TaxID=92696 RepID=A0A4R0RQQ2_9APHY|nr:hypothetical protein EIP91_011981 [Steccherinum ochraceum]
MSSTNAYHDEASPYGSGDPYYSASTGYITPAPVKNRTTNWLRIGLPVLIVVIIAGVIGGVVGTHASSKSASVSGGAADSNSPTGEAAASQAAVLKNAIGVYPTATDSLYMLPIYPSTTNSAAFSQPTFHPSDNKALAWPKDPFQPANPSITAVRPDRPRLIAPTYKWQALPALIANDPYLQQWNATIFGNATQYYNSPPVKYFMDGPSGILDNARETKMRIKAFSYAYRMTNDTKWVDRTWAELQNAISPDFGAQNDTKWNPSHFLDVGEFTAAYAIAYDWLYDQWTDDQKSTIRSSIIQYGLNQGIIAIANSNNAWWGWWYADTINGNWNCVCNNGLTMGALAILNDDQSGIAEQILSKTLPSALAACANGVTSDGSWSETHAYWHFGTTGHAEMSASLLSATGSDYGMLDSNKYFGLTGLFHMHGSGPGTAFMWGDHGPNRFSTTANGMFLYGSHFGHPEYVLHQRDQHDAPEPWSMFWYDPTVSGAYWDNMPLDHFFDDPLTQWAAMRSSWTDETALFAAIKAGKLVGHQTHNDLDLGSFVIDAMGTRWAGELGSGDYRSADYFTSDDQNAVRWLYYRKRTEGQNCMMVNKQNHLVTAAPTVQHDSSGTAQGSSTVFTVPSDSTAFWTADLKSGYADTTSYQRGMRLLNGRKQVLLQDDITASQPMMWRMHTNATVSVDGSGTSATLAIGDKKLIMQILNPTSDMKISTGPATRFSDDPALPAGETDQENPGVTVVMINMDAGTKSLQVLFNPQWPGMAQGDFKTPPSVPVGSWSLRSHD